MAKQQKIEPEATSPAEKAPEGKPVEEFTDAQVVAQRSQDVDVNATTTHRKLITLSVEPPEDYDHRPNLVATVAYAISQGLRPVGEATFAGQSKREGVPAWDLAYDVPVAPAESEKAPEPRTIDQDVPGDKGDKVTADGAVEEPTEK